MAFAWKPTASKGPGSAPATKGGSLLDVFFGPEAAANFSRPEPWWEQDPRARAAVTEIVNALAVTIQSQYSKLKMWLPNLSLLVHFNFDIFLDTL